VRTTKRIGLHVILAMLLLGACSTRQLEQSSVQRSPLPDAPFFVVQPCQITPRDQLREVPEEIYERRSMLFEHVCKQSTDPVIDAADARLASRLVQGGNAPRLDYRNYYPDRAIRAGVQGSSVIAMVMEKGGALSQLMILESSGSEELDKAAAALARDSTNGRGYTLDGAPVRVFMTFPVKFTVHP
jgi:TonB family protein